MSGQGTRVYSYKINNDKWQNTESGEVYIGQLVEDKYYKVDFYVKDELWVSNIHSFVVYIQPSWWQTQIWKVIFGCLTVLLIASILILAIVITRYMTRKANERKSRMLDLELRAIHSQINPHFIFNTLSSAQFFINKHSYDEAYAHVSKFSKLLRSYLKSSQERYVVLAEEIVMLKSYIELQQTRFEQKFEYRIELENKIAADSVKIPSLLLQPLVENAINHGLFHRNDGGLLIITFVQGKNASELVCVIEDNGVGRARAAEIRKESIIVRDSYGTQLTNKLIDIFREYEKMGIEIEYIDKQFPQTGTTVKLTIKNLKYDA